MNITVQFRSVDPVGPAHAKRLQAGFTELEIVDEERCEYLIRTVRPDVADLSAEIRAVCDQIRAEGVRAGNAVQLVLDVQATRSPVYRRRRVRTT